MKVQELVTLVPWTFIAQILNLFIQMYLIKKFLFKPVREILAKRQAAAQAQLTDAKQAKDEAIAMKTEYEQNMAEAKQKASEILTSAQKTAGRTSEEIISEAKQQAASIKAQAQKDIDQEKKKAVNEIKNEIGGLAMDIAGKVIEREVSAEDHKKLIDEFIENVGDAS